jgi:hypothetical protein
VLSLAEGAGRMSKEQNAAALTTFAEAVNTGNYDSSSGRAVPLLEDCRPPVRRTARNRPVRREIPLCN